ncbi:MAG: PIN domain-containing protein [Chloroflexota bacterium]|nr:PIN domain-containing protein [Chloroflexota bacterium]
MLLDANLLLYAVDAESPLNRAAAEWLQAVLNGDQRVGLPWQTIGAFLRISTHPRVTTTPLTTREAIAYVTSWIEADPVWIPPATVRTASVLQRLVTRYQVTGNLVPDAQLAALAIEHGLVVMSADTDFARFSELRWQNPLSPGPPGR